MNIDSYIYHVAGYLRNFRQDGNVYSFSCPVCGDSKKDTHSARGNIYLYKGDWMYHCYNCGYSKGAEWFIKDQFPDEYSKAKLFELKGKDYKAKKKDKPEQKEHKAIALSLPNLLELPDDNESVQLANRRMIPKDRWIDLYHVDKFKAFVETIKPGTFKPETLKFDMPRLVIPFRDTAGRLIGLQGRDLSGKSKTKYLTVKLIPDDEKFGYGLDKLDTTKTVHIVEGAIDSMFLFNGYATNNGGLKADFNDAVYIWDAEPWNKEILSIQHKAILDGKKVVVWNKTNKKKTDINDLAMSGLTKDQIMDIIRSRTFQGLRALVEFNHFKKVDVK